MTNIYAHLSGHVNRMRRMLTFLVAAILMMASQQVSAEVHYIYHEQSTNNPGCGPNYMSTTSPTNAAGVQLSWKIEYQFYTTNTVVYYTTDGTTPSGSFGVGTGTTQVIAGTYNCTFGGPVVDVATATIPAQAAGKNVKYIISAWHSGGGAEIFANGPGSPCGCGTPTSNAGLATVFSYTVAASNNVEVTATGGTKLASYSTLKGAFDAINAGTHTGTIAINLWGNTTETASASLNASGAPASYTSVTITPKNVARTISGNIAGAVIKLNGADNVTIDGRIGGSGNFINVTNTSTSASTAAIWVSSTGVGAGATNNIIRNLNIACGADQTTGTTLTIGIIQSGTILSLTDNGNDNDNNQYLYNNITKCRYGIVTRGATTNLNQGIVVSYNTIGPTAFGSNQIGKVGIFMQADQGAIVSNNTVQFVGGYFANTTSGNDRVGIAIGQESWSMSPSTLTSNSYTVTNNIIHDIIEERGVSAVGITLSTTGGGSPTNNIVANNFIYNVRANGGTNEQTVGIGISGGHTDKVVFNTIYLTGDTDPSASATATANFGSGIRIAVADGSSHQNLTIKNNIVYMDLYSSSNASVRYYAMSGYSTTYNFGTGGEDYNAYYINPSNTQVLTGGLGNLGGATLTSQYASLAAWQGAYASGQDVHSVDDMPLFTSATDLHMQYNESNAPFNGTGVAIAGVTTDIDGATRLSPPDMGADEFTIPVCVAADGGSISPSSDAICDGDNYAMSATGATTGYDITYQWEVSSVGGGAGFSNVTGGTGATTTSYTTDALAAGTYYYRLKVTCISGAIDGYSNEFELTVNPLVTYYADADADTYGDAGVSTTTCDGAPIGYVIDGTDCDDTNNDINPGATEICNAIDDNCDGNTDEGLTFTTYYADADSDTYGDAGSSTSTCDGAPAGYVADDTDCDDANADINPGEAEICNAVDDDCSGVADDGLTFVTYYKDYDEDGYGAVSSGTVTTCDGAPATYVAADGDCDDFNADLNPGEVEICNFIDDNCSGISDEGLTILTFYLDADGDTYGTPLSTLEACGPTGPVWVSNDYDCNDSDENINPAATEICNDVDDDCDGATDEDLTLYTYYADAEGDGFGDAGVSTTSCSVTPPPGYVANNIDCQPSFITYTDADGDYFGFGAPVPCGPVINNSDCDDTQLLYSDVDSDGYGSGPAVECGVPSNTDCAPYNNAINPGATETCNAIDDDCDGTADDGLLITYYADADSDTYGDASSTTLSCSGVPSGYVADDTDCDDTNADINPGESEICNAVDDDCDGIADDGLTFTDYYTDADGDGYGIGGGIELDAKSEVTTEGSVYVYDNGFDKAIAAQTFTPSVSGDITEIQFNINTIAEPGMLINFQLATGTDIGGGTVLYSEGLSVSTTGWHSITLTPGIALTAGNVYYFWIRPSEVNTNSMTLWRSSGGPNPGEHAGGAMYIYQAMTDDFYPSGVDDLDFRTFIQTAPAITACADPGAGYSTIGGDCDDENENANPGETEICNGIDDNCSGVADDGLTFTTYYADADSDTYGDAGSSTSTCDGAPAGYVSDDTDCDDTNENINPGETEVCNAVDDNCDGNTDEGLTFTTYYADADSDTYGDAGSTTTTCDGAPAGYVIDDTDCDDTNADINPGESEVCNAIDEDCDGTADDGLAFITYYADADSDTYGDAGSTTTTCDGAPAGYVADDTDCDDTNADINPGAAEVCNAIDEDCDGTADDGLTFVTYYKDLDADTYGSALSGTVTTCDGAPATYVAADGDCDDLNADINPGETEICNAIDDDCSGVTDDGLTFTTYYADADSDTYGDAGSSTTTCDGAPAGYVADDTDCDDTNADINPGAAEVCNAIDEDCDGAADDGLTFVTYYRDFDEDAYGSVSSGTVTTCDGAPATYVAAEGDCDDFNADINPGEVEICNFIDDNCSGIADEGLPILTFYLDADSDTYGTPMSTLEACAATGPMWVENSADCDDSDADVHPGLIDLCNGIDNDCDGNIDDDALFTTYYIDSDGDTYGDNLDAGTTFCYVPAAPYVLDNTDCNDASAASYPGATEICDGLDNDCDGNTDEELITATVTPAGTVTGCKGSTIPLSVTAGVGYTYQWYKNGNPIPGATSAVYNVTKPAYYQAMVTIPGGCSDVSGATLVQFLSSPNANISAPNGTSLCAVVKLKASFDATYTWQWYRDGSPIAGATNYLYNATLPGSYRCRVTNASGCSRNSASIVVTACKEGEELTEAPVEIFDVYPNPTDEVVNINMELNTENTEAQIFIVNIMGDVVYSRDAAINNGTLSEVITLDDQVAAGLYFVKVYVGNKEYSQQLVIQK